MLSSVELIHDNSDGIVCKEKRKQLLFLRCVGRRFKFLWLVFVSEIFPLKLLLFVIRNWVGRQAFCVQD